MKTRNSSSLTRFETLSRFLGYSLHPTLEIDRGDKINQSGVPPLLMIQEKQVILECVKDKSAMPRFETLPWLFCKSFRRKKLGVDKADKNVNSLD